MKALITKNANNRFKLMRNLSLHTHFLPLSRCLRLLGVSVLEQEEVTGPVTTDPASLL